MCATVCPSQALFFGTREQVEQLRQRSRSVNQFQFGRQTITTKVNLMVPRTSQATYVDVTAALNEEASGRTVPLDVLAGAMFSEEEG